MTDFATITAKLDCPHEVIGPCLLINADCLAVLPLLEAGSVDAVVTDPPYGLGIAYRTFDDTPDNVLALAEKWVPLALRAAKCVVFTPGIGSDRFYPQPDHIAAWIMMAGGYLSSWGFGMWQPILCYGKDRYLANGMGARPDTILTNATDRFEIAHPCPKPIAPWTKVVVRFSVDSDLVCDPFMGSGTTGVACIRTGRRFIGIELDPGYYRIACDRIRREWYTYQGGPLFAPKADDPELFLGNDRIETKTARLTDRPVNSSARRKRR